MSERISGTAAWMMHVPIVSHCIHGKTRGNGSFGLKVLLVSELTLVGMLFPFCVAGTVAEVFTLLDEGKWVPVEAALKSGLLTMESSTQHGSRYFRAIPRLNCHCSSAAVCRAQPAARRLQKGPPRHLQAHGRRAQGRPRGAQQAERLYAAALGVRRRPAGRRAVVGHDAMRCHAFAARWRDACADINSIVT